MNTINIEYRNPNDLIPYPLNAKKHPVEQINRIASSIHEFGFDQPIVIDRKGMIIKGHGRYLASLKLGLQSVPVIVANLSDAMAKASRLADNKVAESDWDNELLKSSIDSLLESMGGNDIDLQSFGFDMVFIKEQEIINAYDWDSLEAATIKNEERINDSKVINLLFQIPAEKKEDILEFLGVKKSDPKKLGEALLSLCLK